MDDNDAQGMIYIIQTPLSVWLSDLPVGVQLAADSYRVIQIDEPPKDPSKYAFDEASQCSDLLGVIVRRKSDPDHDEERIAEVDKFVRELVGMKMRTGIITDLLQSHSQGPQGTRCTTGEISRRRSCVWCMWTR